MTTIATSIVTVLILAGVGESRAAAREWADAGTIVRAVATELKRLSPVLPEGVDVVLDGVPRHVGRADVHVLYTREAVFQFYARDNRDALDRGDTRVFFAEDLRSPGSFHVRSAAHSLDRPARHFHFDRDTLTLAELPAHALEPHDAPSSH